MGDLSASMIAISAGSRHISPLSFCEMLMIVALAFAGMRRKVRVLSMRWATRLALCQQSWPSVTTLCQPEGRCAWSGGRCSYRRCCRCAARTSHSADGKWLREAGGCPERPVDSIAAVLRRIQPRWRESVAAHVHELVARVNEASCAKTTHPDQNAGSPQHPEADITHEELHTRPRT